jgi:HSP20 family protein
MGRMSSEWDEDIQRLGERVDDFFDRVLGFASAPRYLLQHTWRPAVDLYEVKDGLVVLAELPGVDEADLEVTVQRGRLRIAGLRRPRAVESAGQPLQLEIATGRFERVIVLPGRIDADRVEARFQQGILAVHIPEGKAPPAVRVRVEGEGEP